VLYVPEASFNLFSIRAATTSGAQVTFTEDKCHVSIDGELCMEGVKHGDLDAVYEYKVTAMAAAPMETRELWHRRFGHLGYDSLIKLKSKEMVDGISVTEAQLKQEYQKLCEPYVEAKQHRHPLVQHTYVRVTPGSICKFTFDRRSGRPGLLMEPVFQ